MSNKRKSIRVVTADGVVWADAPTLPKLRAQLNVSPSLAPDLPSLSRYLKSKRCTLTVASA